MSNEDYISHSSLSGKDVARVAEKIALAIDKEEIATAIAACLGMAAMLQAPDIIPEDLQEVVLDLSQYLCLQLAEGVLDIMDDGKQMN